ncbi:MAG: PQQ-dependent sugar dehydrogenase [Gemmatimonadaceae bacterium]|nr:PQQ-dependent sugar dehydrogenase [Gemmatimonadaceae bacterium]
MRLSRLAPLLLLTALGCSDSATAPKTGQLSVGIEGLPTNVPSAVLVTGPGAFRQELQSSGTLSSVPAGTYTIAASEVTAAGVRYAATPASQVVSVGADAQVSAAAITYRVASARLTVNVTGLPGGTAASVIVSGPRGFSRTLGSSSQLDLLEPGTYTVAASDVQVSGKTYRPLPNALQVELTPSVSPTIATIVYGAGTGVLRLTISGLPAETQGAIAIAGPNGVSYRLSSSSTIARLEAGNYTIVADIVGSSLTTHVPTPSTQTVVITETDTSAVLVTYGSAALQVGTQLVVEGLTQPVLVTAPDGDPRLFVVERPGRIRIVANGALKATPFLDIRSRVNNTGERGLLGMAFDPQYATNGFFYVYYVDLIGNMALERYTSTPGSDVAGGGGVNVMTITHGGNEHHGGTTAFGPDGMLYLAPGDGRCCGDPQNNAQNLNTLLGKVLRIDVRALPYTIPVGNPFVGQGSTRPEIWAYGLRNPWRFSFDGPGGMLYISDVGQDAREEVNAVQTREAGLNFGWPYMEGSACYNPVSNCATGRTLALPAFDYTHAEGCSVTGGYVYRGQAIPELTGHYLFSDYCRGWLRSFRVQGVGVTDYRSWAGITLPQVVSFGRDGVGEVYVVSGASVWRLVRRVS